MECFQFCGLKERFLKARCSNFVNKCFRTRDSLLWTLWSIFPIRMLHRGVLTLVIRGHGHSREFLRLCPSCCIESDTATVIAIIMTNLINNYDNDLMTEYNNYNFYWSPITLLMLHLDWLEGQRYGICGCPHPYLNEWFRLWNGMFDCAKDHKTQNSKMFAKFQRLFFVLLVMIVLGSENFVAAQVGVTVPEGFFLIFIKSWNNKLWKCGFIYAS